MTPKKRWLAFARGLVAALAVGWVATLVDWPRALSAVKSANSYLLVGAVFISLAGLFVSAVRWKLLLRAVGVSFRLVEAYRAYLSAVFIGLAMPGIIGGDVARVWICTRRTKASLGLVTSTVFFERWLGLVALAGLLSVGLWTTHAEDFGALGAWACIIMALGLLAAFLLPTLFVRFLAVSQRAKLLRALWRRIGTERLNRLSALGAIRIFQVIPAFSLSFLLQFLDIVMTYVLVKALGQTITLGMLLVAVPITYLATILPLSPSGLGVREGTLVFVLSRYGIVASDAALLAFGVFLVRVLVGFVGFAVQATSLRAVRGMRTSIELTAGR
ncbi:MAG: flippase-like domain-containing protein [Deltaproteobacteria bacterium]|nr:flippase-like domain-containing protein [Deltaproteobacteria bacterium]